MVEWPKEKISALPDVRIEALRDNAIRLGKSHIAELCDEILTSRKPVRPRKAPVRVGENHRAQYVSEFHFVCPNEDGITRNSDGTIWTGTWVVAEHNAESSLKYGAVVALHTSKAEPSYLHGVIRAWRKGPRKPQYSGENLTQIEEGILFLFHPSGSPLPWKGDATGEKGYGWAPLPE